MIFRFYGLCALLILTGTQHALSQDADFERLTDQCLQVIANSKDSADARATTQQIANELERIAQGANQSGTLSQLEPTLNGTAAACVAFSRQLIEGAAFYSDANRYASAEQRRSSANIQREKEERRSAEEAENAREKLKLEQRLRVAEVNRRVYQACASLALDRPNEAYTNALCVESFKVNGLPEFP